MLSWLGILFLSASWLFGLEYYYEARYGWWTLLVLMGTLLLRSTKHPLPKKRVLGLAVLLILPAIVLLPWPYRVGPLLLAVGIGLYLVPIPRDWPQGLSHRVMLSGVIVTVQSVVLWLYQVFTSRGHDVPLLLQKGMLGLIRLIGIEAALEGGQVALHSMRQVLRLGMTWELLFGPVVLCFITGLLVSRWMDVPGDGRRRFWTGLFISILIWVPLQAGLQIAWLLHRALRTGYEETVNVMAPFWNPWVQMVLAAGLIPLLYCLLPRHPEALNATPADAKLKVRPLVLLGLSVYLLTLGLFLDRPGKPKAGRIWVDEFHSTWEPTGRPFDTEWYGHDSGYNYACIYDYCDRYFEMDRLTTIIGPNTLADCDVLMVKVPTSRYSTQEIRHIMQFVRDGGGLLLVGEHTNVFNTGTYLNDIAKRFGFRFRDDCLFDIDSPFEQLYQPSYLPHPIVQHMPDMHFAVSCSIDPGWSRGRAAIRSTGLRSLPADYHASNFYPQVKDRADARYGAFVQLWTRHWGKGRVAAFTDSTIFSNFATFEPGKPELMLGMLTWLNYRNGFLPWGLLLVGVGLILAFLTWRNLPRRSSNRVLLLATVLCAWALGMVSVRELHARFVPPAPQHKPYVHVAMDRSVCNTILPKSGFIAGDQNGFGIFERWILRLGYFTSRQQGPAGFEGDLLVYTYPSQSVSDAYREQLRQYVEQGGKILVIDSPSFAGSTANSLLYPFEITLQVSNPVSGTIRSESDWPQIQVQNAGRVEGGVPFLWLNDQPIATRLTYGNGTVTVIGFGHHFSDARMGVTGDVVPDASLRQVFDLQFKLLREIIEPSQ